MNRIAELEHALEVAAEALITAERSGAAKCVLRVPFALSANEMLYPGELAIELRRIARDRPAKFLFDEVRFGVRLAGARCSMGMTQQDLALDLGIAQSAISSFETGRVKPAFDTLVKISEVLDVSVGYLVEGEGSDG